ncbi:MAG: hypothetical protein R6V34_02435 [Bacteroidales bacterium]
MKNLNVLRKSLKFSVKGLPFKMVVIFIMLLTVVSCSKQGPLTLKPIKTEIVNVDSDVFTDIMKKNSLSEYIEIIDTAYQMIPINDGKDWQIDIKVKSINTADKDDEFEISSTGYTPGGTGLFLVDDAGTVIEEWGGVGEFELMNKDVLKDFLKTGQGECKLRFENDAYKFEDYVKSPEKIAGFVIKTSAYKKTNNEEIEQSVSYSGSYGALITKFSNLLDKYISLENKLDEIDTDSPQWDKVFDESDKLEDQLLDLQEEIWSLNDASKLSATELSRFTKLSEKFDDF